MGVFDFSIIDTNPGNGSLFSPDVEFNGNSNEYISFMRHRYEDFTWRQRFAFQISFLKTSGTKKPEFKGPYIEDAKEILRKLGVRL